MDRIRSSVEDDDASKLQPETRIASERQNKKSRPKPVEISKQSRRNATNKSLSSGGAEKSAPPQSILDLRSEANKITVELDAIYHDLGTVVPAGSVSAEYASSLVRSILHRSMIYAVAISLSIFIFVSALSASLILSSAAERVALLREFLPIITGALGLGAAGGYVLSRNKNQEGG